MLTTYNDHLFVIDRRPLAIDVPGGARTVERIGIADPVETCENGPQPVRPVLRAFMLSPENRIPVLDRRMQKLAACDDIMRNGVRTVSVGIAGYIHPILMRIATHSDLSLHHSNFYKRTIPMTLNLIQTRFFLALCGIVLLNSCAGFA